MIPKLAILYLPLLLAEVNIYWPDVQPRDALAGQVEQETCASLTSPKCWNPKTELKVFNRPGDPASGYREYGAGLGQCTVTAKFNCFADAARLDKSLAAFDRHRLDPQMQLRTLVLMDRSCDKSLPPSVQGHNRMAMDLACYNGGKGGLQQDRHLCAATPGCDPDQWFGNVALTSFKRKTTVAGYGKSFFEINREYVANVMNVRRHKYAAAMGEA